MKAIFDSASNRLTINGRHHGNRRMWTVVINATTKVSTERMVVGTDEPCLISELAEIIQDHLRELHQVDGGLIRVRWEAMAR